VSPDRPGWAPPAPSADGFPEAVKLIVDNAAKAILVYGHQETVDSDRGARFSRFFVHIRGSLEPLLHALGLLPANTDATASEVLGDLERTLYLWIGTLGRSVAHGHSYRAFVAFQSRAECPRDEQDRPSRSIAAERSVAVNATNGIALEDLRVELENEPKRGRDIGPLNASGAPEASYQDAGCDLYSGSTTALEIGRPQDTSAPPVFRLVFWDRRGLRATSRTGQL